MEYCFCGKKATHYVKVVGDEQNEFYDCPRCEVCMNRAVASYSEVEVKELNE